MRKELILEVAQKHFSEKGYHASLTDIAKDAGIRKATLYNYFQSKDDLFLEIILEETESYFESKKVEFASLIEFSSEERLHRMFLSIVKYFSNKNKLMFWRWMTLIDSEELKRQINENIGIREKRFMAVIHEVFEKGIKEKEIKELPIMALMNAYYALIHGALDGVLLFDSEDMSKIFVGNVWDVFWQGIKNTNGV